MEGIYYIWMEERREDRKTEKGEQKIKKMNRMFRWYLQREDFWNTE